MSVPRKLKKINVRIDKSLYKKSKKYDETEDPYWIIKQIEKTEDIDEIIKYTYHKDITLGWLCYFEGDQQVSLLPRLQAFDLQ